MRRLQELAGGPHLLPVSSAARIVNRQALPVSRQMELFNEQSPKDEGLLAQLRVRGRQAA
ncbi:hypothetical protein ACFWAR_14340 [Streptomyces sp. NPDC059917]|uniref:hypothetical protein n=1 Tax=Streptomyces sp. NPDC059917 TaxID=3347002 RepID=UPI003669960E